MQSSRRFRVGRVAAVASVLAAVIGAGAAVASVPDSGGVIHGCYQKNNGQLRVTDPSLSNCLASEVPIQWSQTGPAGPAGPEGPQGLQGPPGAAGANGATNTVVREHTFELGAGQAVLSAVTCHSGERTTGGGASLGGDPEGTNGSVTGLGEFKGTVNASFPDSDPPHFANPPADGDTPVAWGASITNTDVVSHKAWIFAVCVSP